MLFRYLSELIQAQLTKWRVPASKQLSCSVEAPETRLQASKGNITLYQGDAIVNAANSALAPGGGVCGAIFNAADYDLLEDACMALGGCPTGEAKVTSSFGMKAPWIVHAVGPVWEGGGKQEPELLAGAYRSSLEEAHKVGARSIAFPAISTGIYGYPLVDATQVAVDTIRAYTQAHPEHFDVIDVLCFDDKTLNCYLDTMAAAPKAASYENIGMTGHYGL